MLLPAPHPDLWNQFVANVGKGFVGVAEFYRFCRVVIGSCSDCIQCRSPTGCRDGTEHDDWNVRILLADGSDSLNTVHDRHFDVEQNDVRARDWQQLQRFAAMTCHPDNFEFRFGSHGF